jgi:hypothetical protein
VVWLPVSLSTWEDIEALRQCFPRAPAWGQAASHQGDVSNMEATAEEVRDDYDDAHGNHMDDGPRRSTRACRPNTRVQGPAWA